MKLISSSSGIYVIGKVKDLRSYLSNLSNEDMPIVKLIKQKLH